MAKKSAVEKNKRRKLMVERAAAKRARLKGIAKDRTMPRNSTPARVRNRCEVTGRPRAFYRKFRVSRIALRDLASVGQIPGMVKSSW